MANGIQTLYETNGIMQSQTSLDGLCLLDSLKQVNQSKNEALDVKTILNLQNTEEADLNFLSNNNVVFKLKEINISCRLTGVPKVLFNLKYLTVLNLSNNSLESLPKEIGNMCNLTVLILSSNRLNCLPKSLKCVQQLNYLDISDNEFSQVPEVIYYGMRCLKVLDLSCNKITTFNYSPGCLITLDILRLSNNLFKELPIWVFDNLCQLQFLYLSENQLHLNSTFVNCCSTGIFDSLKLLNIENCNLRCENIQLLPLFKNLHKLQIGNKKYLNDKRKGRNYMGNLKTDVFKNYRKLKYLYLQNAQIATLPSDFDSLRSIEVLDLSDNLLSWLPESFCNLINLKIINLTSNQLLFLPNNFDKLVNLKQIHLGNNKLYQVPESFCKLESLEFIDLYNNKVEKVSPNIFKQKCLKGIDLELNCLNFGFSEHNVDVDEMRMLYNRLKDSFRKYFCIMGSRCDFQKTKLDGGFEKSSDSHSNSGKYSNNSSESESFSDIDDIISISTNADHESYNEDENWEEKDSNQNEDELFDPNELIHFQQRCDSRSFNLENNFCPAKYHLPSITDTSMRKFSLVSENETVEDGQFDSD